MEWTDQIAAYVFPDGAKPKGSVGDLLQALGDGCQAAVEREIGRTFGSVEYYEAYDGDDRPVLYLDHDPIQKLTAVSIFGAPVTVQTSPVLNPQSPPTWPLPTCVVKSGGMALQLTNGTVFSSGTQNVFVQYTAGLSGVGGDVPQDLVRAVIYWAALLFKDRDRLGIASVTSGQQVSAVTHNLPADVDRLISGWRRGFMP